MQRHAVIRHSDENLVERMLLLHPTGSYLVWQNSISGEYRIVLRVEIRNLIGKPLVLQIPTTETSFEKDLSAAWPQGARCAHPDPKSFMSLGTTFQPIHPSPRDAAPLIQLPIDVWREILARIGDEFQLRRLRLVCKVRLSLSRIIRRTAHTPVEVA